MSAVSPTDGTHPHCGHSRDASNGQQLALINNKIRKTAARFSASAGSGRGQGCHHVCVGAPARWCGGAAWVGLLNAPFPKSRISRWSVAGDGNYKSSTKAHPQTQSCSKYTDQELACVNRRKHESELDLLCEDHLMKPGELTAQC